MILPVILAGGSGERLWPLSRTAYPKQFLSLFDSEHSLFQNTIQRLPANSKFLAPLIVCHEDYRFIVAEQLRQINVRASGIILEPYARNTAPAIATAALWAQQNYPDCTLLILPADHLIADINSLHATVDAAADAVAQNLLVTFGIPAHRPETGYGYIRIGANNRVAQFIEKPDLVTAQKFVNNAEYCWNSGMFFFKPAAYLAELAAPANYPILIASTAALSAAIRDLDFTRLGKPEYANNPSISIDYAVMEKTAHAAVFPLHSAWSDIGNWQAVWEHGNKDAAGNCTYGSVVMHNTSNCLIDARHRLLATLNVQDLVIIETSDALLVANINSGQEIRQLIAKLKDQTHPSLHEHRKVMRPWGWYDCIAVGTGFQVKLISVQPAKSLSLQSHQHRSEHWIVVNGTAKITRGTETLYLQANESTFIPQGVKHQLSNCTANPLEIIEVQSGSYLGEDDIIRYADEHGRAVSAEANV